MPPRICSCSSLLSHLEKLLSAGQTQTPIHFLFYFVSVSYIINPLIIQSLAVSLPLFMSSPFMPFMLSVPVTSNSFSPIIPTPFTAVLRLPFFCHSRQSCIFFSPLSMPPHVPQTQIRTATSSCTTCVLSATPSGSPRRSVRTGWSSAPSTKTTQR